MIKKALTLFISMFFAIGGAFAQDVYFSGNGNNTGKIWKNNTLIYSISDSTSVQLKDLQVASDRTIYTAGYAYDYSQGYIFGRIWMNDSCFFTSDTNTVITRMLLDGEGWVAAGANKVWQNGEVLYTYSHEADGCLIQSLAIDTTNHDLYAGGVIETMEGDFYACIWKNDTILWLEALNSSVEDLCFDGENLYAAGFMNVNDTIISGIIWQNDSILVQTENASFYKVTAFDSSLYWVGTISDTSYVFQDGEPIYSIPEATGITALVVNEYGVYCAAVIDGSPSIWKDGEILYQPEDCGTITGLAVLPPPPPPVFTITVESSNPDWGTVSGGGSYLYGDTIQIEAHPYTNHDFLCWNDGNIDNPRDIIVLQDSTFVASFAISQFTITVESDHPAWGSVTGGGTYYYGDTVVITASAHLGFEFISWTDGNTDNPRTIIVTENASYTAHFGIQQCIIKTEVTPEGAGSVNGGGTYDYGTTIHLTAHSNTGYVFSQWSDGIITNPRSVFVEEDATFTAVFTPLQYEITTECDPIEGGTVSGAGIYDYGTTATLTATPNENYMFLCWSDGMVSNPRHITVTGNANFKALFHLNGTPQYTVTVIANDPTLGTVSGSGTYPQGATIDISATPNMNVIFRGWDDGNTDNPRSVTVTQDMTFTALFEAIPPVEIYTITVSSANPFQGTTYGSGTYPLNQVVNIGATPNSGFYFSGWQDGDMNNPRTIIVTGDAEYIASFAQDPVETYTVNVYYDENQGFVIGSGTYHAGDSATLVPIPADGYYFVKWSDGTNDVPKKVFVDHNIEISAFFNGTGVEENGFETIQIYPNPANDKIRIEGLEGPYEIQIYNAYGMLIKTLSTSENEEIDILDLSTGLYFLRVGQHTTKFVKQ